jgi:predicted RNase H-like HicB family nuclease
MGDTIEECIAMARDAIDLYIATLIDLGQPIPEETVRPQAITLDVSVPELVEAAHPA